VPNNDQAVSVKVVFSKITTFAMVLAAALSIVYLYESKQTSASFFTYYGNVTTKTEFNAPEQITSMSFGHSANGQPLEMTFVSQLWCRPINSQSLKFSLVARRSFTNPEFDGFNQIDGIFMKAISKTTTLSQIGLNDAQDIRSNGEKYKQWKLVDIVPLESSTCYINSDISTDTKLFQIPKHIQFDGNLFDYIVDPE